MEKETKQAKTETTRDIVARRQYWTDQVKQWRSSSLTQKQYCSKEGISLERFGAWKRRLDREGQKQTGALIAVPSRIVSSALHTPCTLKLVVNERYRVEIPDAFSPVTLETVLHVLNRL
jgi:hypothetical protein